MRKRRWRGLGCIAMCLVGCARANPPVETRPQIVPPKPVESARTIAPRAETDVEAVLVLPSYDRRELFRWTPEKTTAYGSIQTLQRGTEERMIAVEFTPKIAGGSTLVRLLSGEVAVVTREGAWRSLGAMDGYPSPNGKWFLRLAKEESTILSLPEGTVLRKGPAIADDDLRLLNDELIGGAKLWRSADFSLACDPKHQVVSWDARGSVAAAITIDVKGDEPRIDAAYLELCDLTRQRPPQTILLGSRAADDDLERGFQLSIAPNEKFVVVAGRDILAFDVKTKAKRFIGSIHFERGDASSIAFSADATRVCVSTTTEIIGFPSDPLKRPVIDASLVEIDAFEGEHCVTRTIPKDPAFHPAMRAYDASQVVASKSLGVFAVLEGKGGSSITRDSTYRLRVFDHETGAAISTAAIELPSKENPENPLGLRLNEETKEVIVRGSALGFEGTWDLTKRAWKTPYSDQRHLLSFRPHGGRTRALAVRLVGDHESGEWRVKNARVEGPEGRVISNANGCQGVFDGPAGATILVSCGDGLYVHRLSDLRRLATVVPIGDGEDFVAFLTGGAVDTRGARAPSFLRCAKDDVLRPWAACEKRFSVPGALESALGGDETWLSAN